MAKGSTATSSTSQKIVQPKKFEKEKKAKPAAAAAASKKKGEQLDFHESHKHLFQAEGRRILKSKDLTRFVRWPRYVRIQRQRVILMKRLKVPPAIHQFSKTLDANPAKTLFSLLSKYRPESKQEKRARLVQAAAAEAQSKEESKGAKPKVLKFGVNHITTLVEEKKAKLVVIAHDVNPIELVLHLPSLCRKMDVPYCIVKGKARLGALVHQKTATCVALTEVKPADAKALEDITRVVRPMFNENVALLKKWGGGILGSKAQARFSKQKKAAAGGHIASPLQ